MNILNRIGIGGRLVILVLLAMAGLVAMQKVSIDTFSSASKKIKEVELLHLTETAVSIVQNYHRRATAGEISTQEAQRLALQAVGQLRYEGNNYFWVTDREPILLEHPRPDLVGTDVSTIKDPNGVPLFSEMVDVTRDGTPGLVAYQWALPNAEADAPLGDKLSVVIPFEPWGWIIGTGAYLTRIEAAQASILDQLNMTLGILSLILLLGAAAITFSVTRPLKRLTSVMNSLTEGKMDTAVPYAQNKTVFGEISRALETFRVGLIERTEMQELEKKRLVEEQENARQERMRKREEEEKQRATEEKAEAEKLHVEAQLRAEREERQQAIATEREKRAAEQNKVVEALGVALQNLSDGNLKCEILEQFPEEYERLRADFNSAVSSLHQTIGSVVNNANTIRNETNDITSAAQDLSSRTEKQASTLEESAAALDQLTVSVKSASEGADEATRIATDAQTNAEAGGDVAKRAVDAMQGIKNSSQEIAKITQVIDEIAFQTNLLALNAGV